MHVRSVEDIVWVVHVRSVEDIVWVVHVRSVEDSCGRYCGVVHVRRKILCG